MFGLFSSGIVLSACSGTELSQDPNATLITDAEGAGGMDARRAGGMDAGQSSGQDAATSNTDAGSMNQADASSNPMPDATSSNPDAFSVNDDAAAGNPDAVSANPDAFTPADTGTIDMDAAASPDAMGNPGLDLTGVWAAKMVTADVYNLPIGATNSNVTMLMRMDIAQSGNVASLTMKLCNIQTDPIQGVTIVYPQTAVDSMPQMQTSVTLNGGVGSSYMTPPIVLLVGWTSSMPLTDTIPSDPSDPRVIDEDNDGNPGVTILVTGLINASIYAVDRNIVTLHGTITGADRVDGLNTTSSDQYVLGSSSALVTPGPINSTQDPDPSKSTFVMVRMQGANACSNIVANAGSLFR
jgi:hypothetical protein